MTSQPHDFLKYDVVCLNDQELDNLISFLQHIRSKRQSKTIKTVKTKNNFPKISDNYIYQPLLNDQK